MDPQGVVTRDPEEIYRLLFPRLVRLAFVLTGSSEEAQDLVQDVFARSADRIATLDEPERYLRVAVVNAVRSAHRRRAVADRHAAHPLADPVMDLELIEFRDALAALPARQRIAIVLRYQYAESDEEIATALGVPPLDGPQSGPPRVEPAEGGAVMTESFEHRVTELLDRLADHAPSTPFPTPVDRTATRRTAPTHGRRRIATVAVAAAGLAAAATTVTVLASRNDNTVDVSTVATVATVDTSPPASTGAPVGRDITEFCSLAIELAGEKPESYVGSPQHLADVRRLERVAPRELRDPLRTFAAFLASDAISAADPESNLSANFPPDVQDANVHVLNYIGAQCGPEGAAVLDGADSTAGTTTVTTTAACPPGHDIPAVEPSSNPLKDAMVPVSAPYTAPDGTLITCVAGWVPADELYVDLSGMTPEEANAEAQRRNGNPPRVFDEYGNLIGHFVPNIGFVPVDAADPPGSTTADTLAQFCALASPFVAPHDTNYDGSDQQLSDIEQLEARAPELFRADVAIVRQSLADTIAATPGQAPPNSGDPQGAIGRLSANVAFYCDGE